MKAEDLFAERRSKFFYAIPVMVIAMLTGAWMFNSLQIQAHSHIGGELVFFEKEFNFGTVTEGEIIEHSFSFTNEGEQSVRITEVNASCGCTTPSYTQTDINPGEKGEVSVKFDSEGQPGKTAKKIFVSHTGQSKLSILTIRGFVEARKIDGKDVTEIGNFRLSDGRIKAENHKRDQFFRTSIKIQNNGNQGIQIDSVTKPDAIWVNYPPFSLTKGETLNFSIVFEPSEDIPASGEIPVIIHTNDSVDPDKTIYFEYNFAEENRPDSKTGAHIQFDSTTVRLGTVIQGDKPVAEYHFTNSGNETLLFNSIRPSCGCTVADLPKRKYEPGKKGVLKITLDTIGKIGDIRKTIEVETNSTNQNPVELILWAEIVEHPSPEKMAMMREMSGNIFKGDCRSCHVNRGIGKLGAALYEADCAMCHGPVGGDEKHHPAQKFTNNYVERITRKQLEQWIVYGTPDESKKHMMPGFHTKEGGPLSDEQVKSLVTYLKPSDN
jgi:mono/diheme cytochrome c family protein